MKKVLVIHPEDVSTDMLQVVYSGKGTVVYGIFYNFSKSYMGSKGMIKSNL